jgi:hypothetical protein
MSAAVEGRSRALWQIRMPRLLLVGAKSKTAKAVLRALRARSRGDWEVLWVSHHPGEPREIYGYPVQVVPGYHRRHLRNICLWWEPELILNTAWLRMWTAAIGNACMLGGSMWLLWRCWSGSAVCWGRT